jgi:tetrahydromethanopterin S-methyltransferase subunit H
MGADFLFYGSLRNAPWVYQAMATTDGLLAYGGRFTGVSISSEEHPLYKVF